MSLSNAKKRELSILQALDQNGGELSLPQLEMILEVTNYTTSTWSRKLAFKGLVKLERGESSGGRPSKVCKLTDSGRAELLAHKLNLL